MCPPVCLCVGVCIWLQVPVEADRGSWVPCGSSYETSAVCSGSST